MLETGITCLSCGVRQLKRFFPEGLHLCIFCADENRREYLQEQGLLELRFERKDREVVKCSCGSYFKHTNRSNDKCALCRPMRKGSEIETEKEKSLKIALSLGKPLMQKKDLDMIPQNSEKNTEEITAKKNNENVKPSIEPKIRSELMHTEESTTKEIVSTGSVESLPLEKRETPLSDSTQLSIQLNEEICSSVTLLSNSSKHLVSYAEKLAGPMMCSEQREVVMGTSTGNIMNAVRCLEEARNTMKAKLEYLKFAKQFTPKMKE